MARPASRFLRRIVGGVLTDRGIPEVTEERKHTSVSGRAMTTLVFDSNARGHGPSYKADLSLRALRYRS
ncbi:MAG: hypothetical protein JWP25_8105 [Bradyrhizobium sp.]|nr:hypothetical protein [Bradyrhizobium sp.]